MGRPFWSSSRHREKSWEAQCINQGKIVLQIWQPHFLTEHRVKDWLYGIISTHPGGTKDTVVDGAFEAEDILSIYHLVNWDHEHGGAGITPQWGKWKNVTSIFPLHNEAANQTLLKHLSSKLVLTTRDLDQIRDLFGAKVSLFSSQFNEDLLTPSSRSPSTLPSSRHTSSSSPFPLPLVS